MDGLRRVFTAVLVQDRQPFLFHNSSTGHAPGELWKTAADIDYA
jgi:hypothetical protein